jgi:RNA polymerase sigma factor (sigma-70 family)
LANGSDVTLHKLALAGRAQDFETFLREQRTGLLNFLRRRVGNDADAQDATQESFTRLLRYADSQPATAWKPLLYRIATNVAHDQARQHATHYGAGAVSLDSEELVSDEPTQEQIIAQEQELAILHAVIMKLPPKCRQVYLLHRMHGMTYPAIAQHCGLSQKTVEMHISKALAALRAAGKAYTDTLSR